MEQAIFGLVGVIIGGVISGLGPYFLAARAERRRARAACRLLEAELRTVRNFLRRPSEVADGVWPEDEIDDWFDGFRSLATSDLWNSQRATLAEVLSDNEWYAVSHAYERIAVLRGADLRSMLAGKSLTSMGTIFSFLIEDIERGAEAVAALARGGTARLKRHESRREDPHPG